MSRSLARLSNRALAAAFATWRAHLGRKQAQRERLEAACGAMGGWQLRRCLMAWKQAAVEEGRMRAVVARLQHGTAVRVLHRWQASPGQCGGRSGACMVFCSYVGIAWHCMVHCVAFTLHLLLLYCMLTTPGASPCRMPSAPASSCAPPLSWPSAASPSLLWPAPGALGWTGLRRSSAWLSSFAARWRHGAPAPCGRPLCNGARMPR